MIMGRIKELYMNYMETVDDISCEEYYNEDWARWMDELELEWVNGELQIIADEVREEELCFE